MSESDPGAEAGGLPAGSPEELHAGGDGTWPRSESGGRQLTPVLAALSAIAPLSLDLYLPALPDVADDLTAGQSVVQLTLSAAVLGLAAGQLIAGPLADRFGRRGPLLLGTGAWALASLLCAFSPTIWVLVAIRLIQGLGGAAGIVLARAIVRDRYEGTEAARMYALLASISGIAPILAPVLGGQLLHVMDWRGLFGVLAGMGLVLLLATAWRVPETLPRDLRTTGGVRTTLVNGRALLGRRAFVAAVLAQGFAFGALFTYISGSSFVLQDGFGLSPQKFSLVFAANSVGIVLAGQLSRALVGHSGAAALVRVGLVLQAIGAGALVLAAVTGVGLPLVLPALFVVVAAIGLVLPNATALAMADAARMAGTASALVGVGQYAVAGIGAPLAGLGSAGSLLPMATVMLVFAVLGGLAAAFLTGRRTTPPTPLDDAVAAPPA